MKWNICLFISVVMWLRDDNLWTNLNQFCVNISDNIMELIVFITHIWLYGRFYISEFTFLFLFPRPLLRYMGTFRANPVAIWSAIANWGVVANGAAKFSLRSYGIISIAPSTVNLYCTYTVIISSGLPEALNSE